jgi:hypothetical protein
MSIADVRTLAERKSLFRHYSVRKRTRTFALGISGMTITPLFYLKVSEMPSHANVRKQGQ